MAYRNKVYVCFDADNDINYYRTLQMWDQNDNIDFSFYNAHDLNNIMSWSSEDTIKHNLRQRLKNTKVMLALIGEKTRYHRKFVIWEMEIAMKLDIPIIAVNLNKKNGIDPERCPSILKEKRVLHIPFTLQAISHALNRWYDFYHSNEQKGLIDFYYKAFD